jgi:Fe-Mn family superoxide dismutase
MAQKFELPKLPYGLGDLDPVISAEIMDYHYNKHHNAYVQNLNALLEKHEAAVKSNDLDKMIPLQSGLDFNLGGHLNHCIFWTNLAPKSAGGGQPPEGPLADAIKKEFGSLNAFIEKMSAKAVAIQGSGWAWLGFNTETGHLEITTTQNHGLTLAKGVVPLLCIDVWEHAYYLQYKNARAGFVKAFWDIVNWKNISERYLKANPSGAYNTVRA